MSNSLEKPHSEATASEATTVECHWGSLGFITTWDSQLPAQHPSEEAAAMCAQPPITPDICLVNSLTLSVQYLVARYRWSESLCSVFAQHSKSYPTQASSCLNAFHWKLTTSRWFYLWQNLLNTLKRKLFSFSHFFFPSISGSRSSAAVRQTHFCSASLEQLMVRSKLLNQHFGFTYSLLS